MLSAHTELLPSASPTPGAAVRTETTTPLPSTSLRGQAVSSSIPKPYREQGEHNPPCTTPKSLERSTERAGKPAATAQRAHASRGAAGFGAGTPRQPLPRTVKQRRTSVWFLTVRGTDGSAGAQICGRNSRVTVVTWSEGGLQTQPWKADPRWALAPPAFGMSRGGCENIPRHGSTEQSFLHAEHQLECAQSGSSAPGGTWELDVLCYLKVSRCPAGRRLRSFGTSQPVWVLLK